MGIYIPPAEAFTPLCTVRQVSTIVGGVFQSIGQIDARNTTAGPFSPVGNVEIVP